MSKTALRPTEEAYGELQHAYDFFNDELFGGQLPSCLITFQRQKKTFGYYHSNRFGKRDGRTTDEIAINPEYFAVVPMVEVLQTVVHEMTHLWQQHFGTPSRSGYHNAQWADKLESIGLMPSNTGIPGGKRLGQQMADYAIAGGPFDSAAKRLVASGFAISWLDRYPAQPPSRFLAQPQGAGSAPGAESSDEDESTMGNETEAAWVAPSVTQPELIEAMKTGNRSNRNKYTCPGPNCSLNVWGKPGLKLKCVDCDVLLSEGASDS